METIIKRPAALIRQGSLTLYATSLKVNHLLIPNFYNVETLDPNVTSKGYQGYQRVLNTARAKKLANYIVEGQETEDAFLPTSIFIATNKDIPFNPTDNTIEININEIGPFNVVDGQHRVEGLRMAAEKDPRVLEFEVAVNIATNLSNIAQMCHFLIVNTTQKSVEKGVEQRIYARLTGLLEVEDIPTLPRWISRTIRKGEDDQALKYVDFLNSYLDSPWYGKIEMANQENKNASIQQKSFVKAIKSFFLVENNPIIQTQQDPEIRQRILLNYWIAITNIIGRDEPTVLFKTNGVELFSRFSVPFFNKMANMENHRVQTMENLLRRTFENMEGDYAGIGHTDFWVKSSKASYLNSGAIGVANKDMVRSLLSLDGKKEIDL